MTDRKQALQDLLVKVEDRHRQIIHAYDHDDLITQILLINAAILKALIAECE